MDSAPVPSGTARVGGDDFRISAPAELATLLQGLVDAQARVSLSTPAGTAYTTTVWGLDSARGILSLAADAGDRRIDELADADEVLAVAYLDQIKLQFDLVGLTLVHGASGSVLNVPLPREIFRFQRRASFRVRPLGQTMASARLRHPAIPDMQLLVRVVDVSLHGVALFIPDDVPPVEPGLRLNAVQLDLDAGTRLTVSLCVMHASALNPQSRGLRLGCEIIEVGGEGLRLLQRYLDTTQKIQRLLAV